MKQVCYFAFLFSMLMPGCKEEEPLVPDLRWELFESPDAVPLTASARTNLEGIYTIISGTDIFGTVSALKWTYDINENDTVYYISFFCNKDITYIICQGKRLDSTILFSGYWRTMVSNATGTVRLQINKSEGSSLLLAGQPATANSIRIDGVYGDANEVPENRITLSYSTSNYNATPYIIVAHRGGGRNANLLPASENSLELLKMASRFGTTGVEIDVRLTSDNMPILYHDETLNERSIRPNGMMGPIVNYSYEQLNALVRLINGERIPSLRQALETILYQTPLSFVWLDIKDANSLNLVRNLQQEFSAEAQSIGRNIEIMIGLPETAIDEFLSLPDYTNIASVCEPLSRVSDVNARIWGASWSAGLQTESVNQIHAQGRKVIAWTVDEPQYIFQFMNEGNFDGLLSNYPSEIAFQYYARH
jgi:glycerophosphoryl diester phosphodiesterase